MRIFGDPDHPFITPAVSLPAAPLRVSTGLGLSLCSLPAAWAPPPCWERLGAVAPGSCSSRCLLFLRPSLGQTWVAQMYSLPLVLWQLITDC